MHDVTKKSALWIGILIGSGLLIWSGYTVGLARGKSEVRTVAIQGVQNIEGETPADFGLFWHTWDVITQNYLREASTTLEDKVYGATRGLVASLGDPYSEFFDPKDSKSFTENIRGDFGGIGAEIGMKDGHIVVVAPITGTPADHAGLKAGDTIFAINGSSTESMNVDEAVQIIRGPKGSTVTLTIFRDGWEKTKDIPIIRDTIVVPTIDLTMEGNIAVISLTRFNANAGSLFEQKAVEAINKGAKGIVLDLRNNPGGYLDVAVDIAGWFVPKGTLVVSEEGRHGITNELHATGSGGLGNLPVAILVNGGSASASEILAGSLRDHGRAVLVGETTFGKGTVQEIIPLEQDTSIKLTVAHWVLPKGQILDHKGLAPDVEVKLPELKDGEKFQDTQREKALEIVKAALAK
jgi:carboxyl-terminal processing protease